MFDTDLSDREVAAMESHGYGKILENIMVVGLLSGAATMGQYLATTLSGNMNAIYSPPVLSQPQLQTQNSNPFTQPQASSNLQKYRPPGISKWD